MSAAAKPCVLVTRPEGEAAEDLCAKLRAAGYPVEHQPLMTLEPVEELPPAQRQRVTDLDRYQHVIFISANAVRFGMAHLKDAWPQWPVGLHWYAIGSATAALLESYGIQALTPGSVMTSEGLLALPQLADVAQQRVLIVKGEGGREKLAGELAQRGARVDTLACYRRLPPVLPPGALAKWVSAVGSAVVLVSSGEGLANLAELLSPAETSKLGELCLIVPSARVADQARDAGFARVVTAENASDAAMLGALATYCGSSGEHGSE